MDVLQLSVECLTLQRLCKDCSPSLLTLRKVSGLQCRAILAAGGKMKLKKLQKQLLQDCGLPKVEQTQALNDMTMQLTDSKQFRVAGSSIALVA